MSTLRNWGRKGGWGKGKEDNFYCDKSLRMLSRYLVTNYNISLISKLLCFSEYINLKTLCHYIKNNDKGVGLKLYKKKL